MNWFARNASKLCSLFMSGEMVVSRPDVLWDAGDVEDWQFDPALWRTLYMDGDGCLMSDLPQMYALSITQRQELKEHMKTVHTKFNVSGDSRKVALFHAVLRGVDKDYPISHGGPAPHCSHCHGLVWVNAVVQPEGLKRAAKQIGVRISINHFIGGEKCKNATVRMLNI